MNIYKCSKEFLEGFLGGYAGEGLTTSGVCLNVT